MTQVPRCLGRYCRVSLIGLPIRAFIHFPTVLSGAHLHLSGPYFLNDKPIRVNRLYIKNLRALPVWR